MISFRNALLLAIAMSVAQRICFIFTLPPFNANMIVFTTGLRMHVLLLLSVAEKL